MYEQSISMEQSLIGHEQCDQIGLFLKRLCDTSVAKVAQMYSYFCAILKTLTTNVKLLWLLNGGTLSLKLGYIYFHHLVTNVALSTNVLLNINNFKTEIEIIF